MNEITYNNKNLSDFGVYYDSHSSFGSPERDVELVEIAGKNGALIIDNDRFRNIDLAFPCYVHTNFLAQYRSVMAYLQSCTGYNRLEITQEPNHFRMASFNIGSQPTPNQLHRSGQFPVVFNCKPQRFLKSGEIPVSASSQSVSYEGNPVSIDNPSGISAVNSLAVALSPVQNLNGYDSPWIGGAGKNKLDATVPSATTAGITFTVNPNGSVKVSGTATGNAYFNFYTWVAMSLTSFVNVVGQTVKISGGTSKVRFSLGSRANASATPTEAHDTGSGATLTLPSDTNYQIYCALRVLSGQTVNETIYPMVRLASETDASFAPYENICPISGWTQAKVTRTGKNFLDTFGRTFSASSETVNTIRTEGSTASFQGDSIVTVTNGPWSKLRFKMEGLVKGQTYTLSAFIENPSENFVGVSVYNGTSWVRTNIAKFDGTTVSVTFDYDDSFPVLVVAVVTNNSGSATNATVTVRNIQLELGSTNSAYEPFDGNTYTINLNGERYGGSVNLATGVLTVTHASITLNSANMNNSETYPGWSNAGIRAIIGTGLDRQIDVQLNIGQRIGVNTMSNYDIVYLPVYVYGMNQTQWKAKAMDVQIVAEYATPQTVQLTPQQISLLTGINYISSSDEVTVTVSEPSLLENPTLFESKPLIRVYGHGTLIVNNQYVTIAENSYEYIDIDCDIMDAFYGANNANQYVTLPNDYITLKSGNNYIAYDGTVEITPRWFEI